LIAFRSHPGQIALDSRALLRIGLDGERGAELCLGCLRAPVPGLEETGCVEDQGQTGMADRRPPQDRSVFITKPHDTTAGVNG
jgi:hypothetical protein